MEELCRLYDYSVLSLLSDMLQLASERPGFSCPAGHFQYPRQAIGHTFDRGISKSSSTLRRFGFVSAVGTGVICAVTARAFSRGFVLADSFLSASGIPILENMVLIKLLDYRTLQLVVDYMHWFDIYVVAEAFDLRPASPWHGHSSENLGFDRLGTSHEILRFSRLLPSTISESTTFF
jgi:hypothetical protein